MDVVSKCRTCGTELGPPRGGQPRFYCPGGPCRRRAEYVQRRLDRLATHLDRLEVERHELEARGTRPPTRDPRYRYWRERVDRLVARIDAHKRQMKAVAAELVGDPAEPKLEVAR